MLVELLVFYLDLRRVGQMDDLSGKRMVVCWVVWWVVRKVESLVCYLAEWKVDEKDSLWVVLKVYLTVSLWVVLLACLSVGWREWWLDANLVVLMVERRVWLLVEQMVNSLVALSEH